MRPGRRRLKPAWRPMRLPKQSRQLTQSRRPMRPQGQSRQPSLPLVLPRLQPMRPLKQGMT